MKKEIIVALERPARKAGGDRYTNDKDLTIYIPQSISRQGGQPAKAIKITFEPQEVPE